MADGRDSTPTDPRFFFLAARGPSLPALPTVSRDRRMQEYSGCSSVLAIVLAELILVHACAVPYVPEPPYCTYGLHVPASWVACVPEAQGSTVRTPYAYQPRV